MATADVIGRGKVRLGHVSVESLLFNYGLFNDHILLNPLRNDDLLLRHNVILHMLLFRLLFIFLFFASIVILLLLLLYGYLWLIFHILWLLLLFLLGRQEVVDGDKDERN